MKDNNAEVIFQTRSPIERRRGKDRRLFFKQEYLDHKPERRVDLINRRTLGERRKLFLEILDSFGEEVLFFEQEYLDHKPERRVNMTNRRISGDRRGVASDIINTFWKEDL